MYEPQMSQLTDTLRDFREAYHYDTRNIEMYLKSKKYSKLGVYATGILIYLTLASFLQNWPSEKYVVVGLAVTTGIVFIVTVLLFLNARNSGCDSRKVACHDIAALVEAYEKGGKEELLEYYEQVEERILDNDFLSPERQAEVANFFDELSKDLEKASDETVRENLSIIVEDVERPLTEDLQSIENAEEESLREGEPGFLSVVANAINSENINSTYVFWIVFFVAALIGTGIAIWKGQGWGVLVVTILFGALRLHENRTS